MIEDTLNIYWKQTRFTLISCQNAPRKKPLGHLVFFGCYCLPSLTVQLNWLLGLVEIFFPVTNGHG